MKPTHIVLHCSATKDSGTVSWGAIRDYHMNKGWSDIGYHYGIELIGDAYEILMGRMANRQGAHCRAAGMNKVAIGVCCIGNFDLQAPTPNQLSKCLQLVTYLMDTFNIPKDNVIGHHEVESRKTCPGTQFDVEKFRTLLP